MKLSEINPSQHLKALVVGPPGAGKTCFACSLPYPILLLDFDSKADSAAAFHSKDKERLENIDVRDLGRKLADIDMIAEMNRIIKDELIPSQAGGSKYKTLVIDSMTTFSAAVLTHIVKTNPGVKRVASAQGVQPGMSDYGILRREFARLIPGLLSLPMNVVMLAHVKTDKDELTGQIVRGPLMDGSFAQELPVYFKEAYRAFMKDGKPWVQTKSDVYYDFCRSQIPGIPKEIELTYEALTKKYV